MEPRFRVSFFNYPYYNLSFAGAKVVPFFEFLSQSRDKMMKEGHFLTHIKQHGLMP